MDENNTAVKQYNWKGEVVGYQRKNSWIPAGVDSYSSREIEKGVSDGAVILLEPEIPLVYYVNDDYGKLRGYLWNDIFIANDESNALFKLIKKRIEDGICKIEKEPQLQIFNGKKVASFVIGIYFDSQWLSIKNEINAVVDYSFRSPSAYSYNVRFKNLYSSRSPSVEEIIKNERGIASQPFHFDEGVPRGSILEITLPIENIRKVFKIYRQKMHSINFDISCLDDQLDMHLAKTGRSPKRGPEIEWLMNHLWEYIDDFILDIGNRALDYISYSGSIFEDQNIKHITKRIINSRNYILRKYDDNTYEQHKMSFFSDYRFYNADEQRVVLNENDQDNIINETNSFRAYSAKYREIPLKKVRTMIESGLTLEALCLLNGYLEVEYKTALRRVFSNDTMKKEILALSHRNVLSIVKSINSLPSVNSYNFEVGEKYREYAEEIYSRRNDYLHALELPEESVFMTNSMRITLETLMNPFVQPHETHQFLIHIDGYRCDYKIQELICNALHKKKI